MLRKIDARARVIGMGLVAAACVGLWGEHRAEATRSPAAATAALPARAGNVGALRFDANQGQFDDQIRFLARGRGYGLFLTRDGATLSLKADRGEPAVVSVGLVGGRSVEPVGDGELAGRSNYFVGKDPNRWRSGVPSFGSVRYPDVLPGVDMVFYAGRARELEYDLIVRPGVDAGLLEVELGGVVSVTLADDGAALLRLPDGSLLRKGRPQAYQVDERGGRTPVAAEFKRISEHRLGFSVANYDRAHTLIIDPVLSYASYLGGSRFDEFFSVAADSAGNTLAVGYTTGTLFPTKSPAQPSYGGGAADAIICKLNAAGNALVFATYLGGNDADRAYGVAVDAAGSAYVTGLTYSTNFPTTSAPLQGAHGGGLQDAFVAKLSAAGSLVYSTYLGGSGDDFAQGIAVRSTGEAYVVGTTFSANFPHAGGVQGALGGTNDAFVARLAGDGNALVYSTYLGGSGSEYGQGVAVDSAGSAYVVGQTGSSNFPTASAAQNTFGGAVSDGFVTRLSAPGSAIVYSTYLGGVSGDVATGVAQLAGSAIVVGYTSSFNFPTANATQASLGGGSDAFLSRVNASGTSFDFSTYLGGSGNDSANGVALDAAGFLYVTGQTASSNFPVDNAISGQGSPSGAGDAFLAGYDTGGRKLYSSYLGGSAADTGVAVAAAAGALHVLGNTLSTNFPTQGALFAAAPGPQDGFVARLPTLTVVPAPWGSALSLALYAMLLLGGGMFALSVAAQQRDEAGRTVRSDVDVSR
jgi:hypothetical protein